MTNSNTLLQGIERMKMLAHRFELKGGFDISYENTFVSIELEGSFKKTTNKESYVSFEQFFTTHGAYHNPETVPILQNTLETLAFSNQPDLNCAQILSRYQETTSDNKPKTISIISGWDQHAVGIVLHGDKLYVCNRGQGSDGVHGIIEYHIGNPSGLTENLIHQMISATGSPYFLQTELIEKLALTEIERYDAPPQTVGNCAWANAIESIHATLLAQYSDTIEARGEATSLANTLYQEWVTFDLNQALAQLPHFETDPHQHKMVNDVLGQILSLQQDAQDTNQIQRALHILPHLDDPLDHLKNLENPAFEQQVEESMQEYISLYNESHWYDGPLNNILNFMNLGSPSEEYEAYSHDVHLGKELSELGIIRTDPIATSSTQLQWEDVFPTSKVYCHSQYTPETPLHTPIIDPLAHLPEFVHDLI